LANCIDARAVQYQREHAHNDAPAVEELEVDIANRRKNMNRSICTALLVLSVAAAPAWSQGKLDAHTMKAFGGTYQIDCSSNTSPKATVFADALVFLDGDKRVAGSKVQAAAAYFGNSPPPDYRTVLLSEMPGGQELLFTIYEDKSGYYLKLDGDQKTMAAIGKPLSAQKFRRCDGASKPMHTATAATAQKKYALHELGASGVLDDPKAKATYYKALGPLSKERWLAKLDGPSPQNKRVKVAGDDFVLLSVCKNHDCAENNTVLLYSGAQDLVYGRSISAASQH
jgi:hypothetical protein